MYETTSQWSSLVGEWLQEINAKKESKAKNRFDNIRVMNRTELREFKAKNGWILSKKPTKQNQLLMSQMVYCKNRLRLM
jgi:flagellar biosynthesis/type III secretory pathway chaperone